MTYAKVIADSVTGSGDRLTTLEVRFHRFVLAEFNTHRVFSRNSASSRAIPLAKQIERLTEQPASPVYWPREQKGMQGGEELDSGEQIYAENIWLRSRAEAINAAKSMSRVGLHKSLANRILEPFMWQTVVVTSTAWENFLSLRSDKMAQPEIRVVAEMMEQAMMSSEPSHMPYGMWHLPYISVEDREYAAMKRPDRVLGASSEPWLVKVSSARCARVSYLTQDGKRDYQQDIDLYERLTSNGHSSPLEHVATPMPGNRQHLDVWQQDQRGEEPLHVITPKYGNLIGWHQHRFDVEARRNYRAYS